MAAPKQRQTKSRRNKRRSHHALKKQGFSICSKCREVVLPHRICSNCGTYAGREVFDVLAKLDKKEKKKKEKELAGQPALPAGREQEQAQEKGLSMEELSKS